MNGKKLMARVLLIPRGRVVAGDLVFKMTGAALRKMAKAKAIPLKLAGRSVGAVTRLKVTRRGLVGDMELDRGVALERQFRHVSAAFVGKGRRT